ncbi:antiviral RADAR system adenosine deaminase RdrB [Burkholderia cepacia]|uniref:antiviral RADAR system adenosine deaminase RdrB n=1 Tax=Burkholderia cepacia TaxID=292 RepID=UPI002FE1E566
MLKRSLQELATGRLLSSDDVAAELRKYLQNPWTPPKFQGGDDAYVAQQCREALERTLEREHHREFRRNDLHRAVDVICSGLMSPRMPMLDELFTILMMRNGDFLQYRPNRVQAFVRLSADIDPTLLVGWHIAGLLERTDAPTPDDMRRIVSAQMPMFAPVPASNKPFAENHVHHGGVTFDGFLLAEHLLSSREIADCEGRATLQRLRRVLRVLLDMPFSMQSDTFIETRFQIAIDEAFVGLEDELSFSPDWQTLANQCDVGANVDNQALLFNLSGEMSRGRVSTAWLWLVVYLWALYRREDALLCVRVGICYLFTELMSLRRRLIMDGHGLTRFVQDRYNLDLRWPKDRSANDIDVARRLLPASNDLVEIKIAPFAFKADLARRLAEAVTANENVRRPDLLYDADGAGAADDSASALYLEHLNRWHFCAHLLRSRNAAVRDNYRTTQWKQVERLHEALHTESGWRGEVFLNGHANSDLLFQPARWLRGLDVAGDENETRIELLAPMLRWLRHGLLSRPDGERASSGFHLSVHAGEDYAHPLSGMRHIDETVRFCDMCSGDRLGHALAIGIEPAVWAERHGDIILSVDEHLDNLVWAWHYATELSSCLPLAARILPRLERRIARFAREIPWLNGTTGSDPFASVNRGDVPSSQVGAVPVAANARGRPGSRGPITDPDTLHRAWCLRRNCSTKLQANVGTPIYDELLKSAVPDFEMFYSEKASNEVDTPTAIFVARELEFDARQGRPLPSVVVRVAATGDTDLIPHIGRDGTRPATAFFYDYETADDLEFMHALQDHLLQRFDEMGLLIEANPTSNVYIASLNSHEEHPIFRWNPPDERHLVAGERFNRFGLRRGPIKVLINTDDPGIMPTTLRTEYALLLEAAIDNGYSRTTVEAWLERARQEAIDQFHRNHLPIFTKRH